jgi:hypothetical protein
MSLKDKLEIGLKPDAPYRQANLPDFQQDDPACDVAATPGDTRSLRKARQECAAPATPREVRRPDRRAARGAPAARTRRARR